MTSFQRHKGEQYSGWIHAGFQPIPDFLDAPEELISRPGVETLLDCSGRRIFRLEAQVDGSSHPVFVYLYSNGSFFRALQRSYAGRVFRISRELGAFQIQTIEVLAALKKRRQILNWTSLVVAREIAPVQQLAAAGRHILDIHPEVELKEALAENLGAELARLHTHNFFHGDLKSRHILYRPDSKTFCFVDLEKCSHHPLWPRLLKDILAARDLIQLFSSLPQDPVQTNGNVLLEHYLSLRKMSQHRKGRLRQLIRLYGPEGGFRQGRTVLQNLKRLRARKQSVCPRRDPPDTLPRKRGTAPN